MIWEELRVPALALLLSGVCLAAGGTTGWILREKQLLSDLKCPEENKQVSRRSIDYTTGVVRCQYYWVMPPDEVARKKRKKEAK